MELQQATDMVESYDSALLYLKDFVTNAQTHTGQPVDFQELYQRFISTAALREDLIKMLVGQPAEVLAAWDYAYSKAHTMGDHGEKFMTKMRHGIETGKIRNANDIQEWINRGLKESISELDLVMRGHGE